MNASPYPDYRTVACVSWPEKLPAHWDVRKLSHMALLRSGEGITSEEIRELGQYPVYGGNGTRGYCDRYTHDGEFVLIGRQGALCGNINYAGGKFWASEHAVVVRPLRSFATRWMGELLRAMNLNQHSVSAAQPGLSVSAISALRIPVPPVDEQRAIAEFLDCETTKVDKLIETKKRLLVALEARQSAIISQTISLGLPSNDGATVLNSRETGKFPWIGNLPAHWETRRLKHISDGVTVGVVVNPSSYVSDEGVPFLLGGNVRELRIDISNCKRCPVEISDGALLKSRLNAGDVVVVRVGYPGVAAVVPPELDGANCASMMIVRRNRRFNSQWLAYAFNSQLGRDQVQLVQYGAAQKQFNVSHAVDFTFPFPPIEEQEAIAAYLDEQTSHGHELAVTVEGAVSRLREYRSSLISAAVTGQIDVRTYCPQEAAVLCP
jgi:type I restriction enzyme S subunit